MLRESATFRLAVWTKNAKNHSNYSAYKLVLKVYNFCASIHHRVNVCKFFEAKIYATNCCCCWCWLGCLTNIVYLTPSHIRAKQQTISILYTSKLVYIEALKLIDNLNCSADIITISWFRCSSNFKFYVRYSYICILVGFNKFIKKKTTTVNAAINDLAL